MTKNKNIYNWKHVTWKQVLEPYSWSLIETSDYYNDINLLETSAMVDWYEQYSLTKNFNDITLEEFEEEKMDYICELASRYKYGY